jgi:pyruvate/2-oxoglutarate dehydrogenase complex dihydrolipoamide acyltransferase (E2) component
MPSIPIIMPQLGESIAEATVVNLLIAVGDKVQTDQDIIEVETSKATMNVASPCPGRVEKFLAKPGCPCAAQKRGRRGQRHKLHQQRPDPRRA